METEREAQTVREGASDRLRPRSTGNSRCRRCAGCGNINTILCIRVHRKLSDTLHTAVRHCRAALAAAGGAGAWGLKLYTLYYAIKYIRLSNTLHVHVRHHCVAALSRID